MSRKRNPQLVGIKVRHERACRSLAGGECSCRPSYRGRVTRGRGVDLHGPWTRSLSEARAWRARMLVQLDQGEQPQLATKRTVGEAADDWLAGARAGTIRNRSGRVYKPSALRSIDEALELRVRPVFGYERLTALTRPQLQRWIGALLEDGLSASSVRNAITALRVVYRRAVELGEVERNPTAGLRLPAIERHEPRIVPPAEADKLLAVLPDGDRAIWATAFYAGLRRGELWGLRVGDVDVGEGILRVRHGEDAKDGRIDPKSRAGFRPVPIVERLADELRAHLARLDDTRPEARVFPGARADRFSDSALVKRSRERWREAGLEPVGLHDCRHTFASFGIAAGWNAKTLQTYMGHSSIAVTFDIYGHLFPGNEAEARELLDTYLSRSSGHTSGHEAIEG